MVAPRDIVDALESVISIYFSDVRHRARATFILADELVEMTCKAKARQTPPPLGHIAFVPLLQHATVGLSPTTSPLGATLATNHQTRNQLQHVNAALSVDDQHCADAVLDALNTIEHCFPNSTVALPDVLRVALRVIRLHSSQGNLGLRGKFEDDMRTYRWNGGQRSAKINEPPIPVGIRRYWGLIVMPEFAEVEAILNRLGVP